MGLGLQTVVSANLSSRLDHKPAALRFSSRSTASVAQAPTNNFSHGGTHRCRSPWVKTQDLQYSVFKDQDIATVDPSGYSHKNRVTSTPTHQNRVRRGPR